jgi:hypothetical protein
MLFQQVKSSLQLLIDEGALQEKKKIKMVDCEGKHWSWSNEDNRTLKIVSTDGGINLIEIQNITIHRWDEEMIIGVQSSKEEITLFFLERGDEFVADDD